MREMRKLALGTALGCLFIASAARADDDDDAKAPPPPPKPFIRWSPYAKHALGIDDLKPTPPKPDPKAEAKKPAAQAKKVPAIQSAATQRSKEENALLRRLAVCDKLMEIASQTNDRELMRRAEQLSSRAWAIYDQHTGMHADAKVDADAQKLDRALDQQTVTSRPSQEAVYSVSASDRLRQSGLGEVSR
jgi:hypothetical protein